jgi:hypothetical protein
VSKIIYYTPNPDQPRALVYRVRATILGETVLSDQFLIVHPDTLKVLQEKRPDIEFRLATEQWVREEVKQE